MVVVLVLLVLILVMVMMVVLVLLVLILIVVMVVVLVLFFLILIVIIGCQDFFQNLLLQVCGSLDSIEDHSAVELGDRSCDDRGVFIDGTKQLHALVDLLCADLVSPAQDDRSCVSNLIVKEFSEVLEIDFALCGIHDRHSTVQMHLGMLGRVIDGAHDV